MGGAYRIAVKVKDEVGGTEIMSQLDVQVRGLEIEPSDTLAARNLRFLRSEEDAAPLDPAVYHPGEMLWARFEITGYKLAKRIITRCPTAWWCSKKTASRYSRSRTLRRTPKNLSIRNAMFREH